MKIAITGANGFVGVELCRTLESHGIEYVAVLRQNRTMPFELKSGKIKYVTSLNHIEELRVAFTGCTCVVHLAAKVHQQEVIAESVYINENVDVSKAVLEASLEAGVGRFVFLSTIKVYGESQTEPYTVESPCCPQTPYGKSKLTAENVLLEICKQKGIDLDIIRIPLVIGDKAKGNVALLEKLIETKLPLPFGAFKNRRSQISLKRMTNDLMALALEPRRHIQRLHLWADEKSLSTKSLVEKIGAEKGRRVRVFWFPLTAFLVLGFFCDLISSIAKKKLPFGRDSLGKMSDKMEVTRGLKELK